MTNEISERVAAAKAEYVSAKQAVANRTVHDGEWIWNGVQERFDKTAHELASALETENERLQTALAAAERERDAAVAALEQTQGYAAFLRSCALCGEQPETFEWYLAKEASVRAEQAARQHDDAAEGSGER